jgi:hypothetical protein
MRFSGSEVFAKFTTMRPPSWRRSAGTLASVSSTMMRPEPSAPRRKSMLLTLREPVTGAAARVVGLVAAAAAVETAAPLLRAPAPPPTDTMIVLPLTRVSYGTRLSTLSTTRVRPFASATLTVSTTPCLTSTRREAIETLVSGRSSAMRAGLSTVKVSGVGALSLSRSVSSTLLPAPVVNVMPSSRLAPCASACRATPANSTTPRPSRRSDEIEDDICTFLPGIILSTPAPLDARCIRRDRRGRSR